MNERNQFSCFVAAVVLLSMLPLLNGHYIPKIKGPSQQITGYINQAKQIEIPFKKCFQVQPQLAANSKFLTFQPSSLKLSQLQKLPLTQNHQISTLQQLRNPRTNTHEHLLIFQSHALTFKQPNTILVFKLDQFQKFKHTNTIQIKEIDQYTRFRLYKLGQYGMLIVESYDKSRMNKNTGYYQLVNRGFMCDEGGYWEVKVDWRGNIAHFEGDGNEFYTAEYADGISCYSYNEQKKTVSLVANYTSYHFQNVTSYPYIVDINIRHLHTHNIIYALDSIKGIYRLNLTQSPKSPKIQLIVSQPNCHAMDTMNIDHLVLVCQLGTSSYIIEAYSNIKQNGQIVFQKLQPEYHVNYFNDLEINKNYFLVFSYRMLNVYWSAKENNIPETVNTRSQLDLPGLQTFYFRMNAGPEGQSYLYIIQSGTLKQLQITQSPAKLSIKSQTPIQKKFKISIFGNCQDLPKSLLQQQPTTPSTQLTSQKLTNKIDYSQYSTCELQTLISLQTLVQNSPRKQDFSVSASIIVILIVIFLLIIWICLKKYKGLEKQARRVLDAYKKKKNRRI